MKAVQNLGEWFCFAISPYLAIRAYPTNDSKKKVHLNITQTLHSLRLIRLHKMISILLEQPIFVS